MQGDGSSANPPNTESLRRLRREHPGKELIGKQVHGARKYFPNRSASRSDAKGPARNCLKSMTNNPSSGPLVNVGFLIDSIQFGERFSGSCFV